MKRTFATALVVLVLATAVLLYSLNIYYPVLDLYKKTFSAPVNTFQNDNNYLTSVQQKRQSQLQTSCDAEKEHNKRIVPPLGRAMVYPHYKVALCQIPKSGSTFWREILGKVYQGKVTTSFKREKRTWMWKNFTIFVRHPLTRLYSCYNDKLVGLAVTYGWLIGGLVSRLVRKSNPQTCYGDISFEEFVQMVTINVRRKPFGADPHWLPQHRACTPCERTWDFIGHLETFNQDISDMGQVLKQKHINMNLTIKQSQYAYLSEKCRLMSMGHMYRLRNKKCNTVDVMVKAKLKAAWNKGYLPEYGFTESMFKALPVQKWNSKCMELVNNIQKDPKKKARVRKIARETAINAIRNLSNKTFNDYMNVFRKDFVLFGYNITGFR